MSFTFDQSSASERLTFKPSRLDVLWDGVSNGKVSLLPLCSNTSSATSYSVKVLHVFPASETKVISAGGVTSSYSAVAGEPFRNNHTNDTQIAVPFVIGSTLNTSSGEVSFELTSSDTNYTATLDFATYRTAQASSYQWQVEKSEGAAIQLVAVGQLRRTPPNAFAASDEYGELVSAKTAFFCVG